MKTKKIGQFHTSGKLIVTDPCYEPNNGSNYTLKVKPGNFNVFVTLGQYKNAFFECDKTPGFFRNSQIMIVHEKYKNNFKFKKTTKMIGVDSGQAGFFNQETYNQEYPNEFSLTGKQSSFFKDNVLSSTITIKRNKKLLKDKEKDELYSRMKTHFKSDEKTVEWFSNEIIRAKDDIKRSKEVLKTKNYPYYIKLEKTKDFYEIMCDLTKRDNNAGVCDYGAVSSSGLGDGGYELYIAKNKKGEVVASYIKFLDKEDIK